MRMKPDQRVQLVDARARTLACLSNVPISAATIAAEIWPNHPMTAQGAGGAASRVLKKLEKDGLAKWAQRDGKWGWVRTERVMAGD
jgi:hypothetical protein